MLRIGLATDRVSATRFADRVHGLATCVTIAFSVLGVVASIQSASAGDLDLRVLDRAGRGVPDVVVVAVATSPSHAAPAPAARTAVMDQKNRKFVPQVLVVQTGTVVAFPNNDTISHQVYSFSPSRRFQLPLYKGEAHSPVAFNTPGLVVLGCNIHDEMVGYVYVTDSPYFATTDTDGNAGIRGLPAGSYRLDAWGPRVADSGDTLVRDVALEHTGNAAMEWRLQRPLRPRPSPGPRDVDWDY
jgi:plastocyanin